MNWGVDLEQKIHEICREFKNAPLIEVPIIEELTAGELYPSCGPESQYAWTGVWVQRGTEKKIDEQVQRKAVEKLQEIYFRLDKKDTLKMNEIVSSYWNRVPNDLNFTGYVAWERLRLRALEDLPLDQEELKEVYERGYYDVRKVVAKKLGYSRLKVLKDVVLSFLKEKFA